MKTLKPTRYMLAMGLCIALLSGCKKDKDSPVPSSAANNVSAEKSKKNKEVLLTDFEGNGFFPTGDLYAYGGNSQAVSALDSSDAHSGTHSWRITDYPPVNSYYYVEGLGACCNGPLGLDSSDAFSFYVNTGSSAEARVVLTLYDIDGEAFTKYISPGATNGWVQIVVPVTDLTYDIWIPNQGDGVLTAKLSELDKIGFVINDNANGATVDVKIDDIYIVKGGAKGGKKK